MSVLAQGINKQSTAKCFSDRPFTRILSWGRDLKNVLKYLHLNEIESAGISRPDARILLAVLSPPRTIRWSLKPKTFKRGVMPLLLLKPQPLLRTVLAGTLRNS